MATNTQRVCFQLRVKPEHIAEYNRRHAALWPEMLHALKSSGWNNYSLFQREDGLVIGYFETEDLAAANAAMARTDVNARWQADMAEFFEEPDGTIERSFVELIEVFNLEDQLSATPNPTSERTAS